MLRFTLAAILLSSPLVAAEPDGKALYTQKMCHTCHGPDGKKPIAPNYPKLAGQSSLYMQDQIKLIKSGKRNSGLAATMQGMVATLTDADIKALSDYLEKVAP